MATNDVIIDVTCPYCARLVRPLRMSDVAVDSRRSRRGVIAHCPDVTCGLMYVVLDDQNGSVVSVFPGRHQDPGSLHDSIPESIRADLAEAHRSMSAFAYRSVVVMCRRAMQSLAEDKGVPAGRLETQIDELARTGLITDNLRLAAHAVRHFGNFGAHPRDDGLDDISSADAQLVLAIVGDFVLDIYVRPSEIRGLEAKQTQPRQVPRTNS